jgi:hypothetical protein
VKRKKSEGKIEKKHGKTKSIGKGRKITKEREEKKRKKIIKMMIFYHC